MYMYILFRELFDFFVNNFCKINGEVNNMRDVYLWNRGSRTHNMCKYYLFTRHNLMVLYKVFEIDFSCVSIICILIDEYLSYINMTLDISTQLVFLWFDNIIRP